MPAGRPRKPTATKILEGDQPCRINRNEPTPPPGGVGPPPRHLDELGAEAWTRLARILDAMKVLTSADAEALAIYAVNYSTWRRARDEMGGKLTVQTQFSFKPHPLLAVVARCEGQMAKILGQFGMTPSARSALDLGRSDDEDEFDRWVKEGQQRPANGPAKAPKTKD